MEEHLLTLQDTIKETYKAVIRRDYEDARQSAQQAGEALESLEGHLTGTQEEARLEALSALGDGMQSNYHDSQTTQGIRAFGRVVSNSRIILQRQLDGDDYTFNEVLDEVEE